LSNFEQILLKDTVDNFIVNEIIIEDSRYYIIDISECDEILQYSLVVVKAIVRENKFEESIPLMLRGAGKLIKLGYIDRSLAARMITEIGNSLFGKCKIFYVNDGSVYLLKGRNVGDIRLNL